MKKLIILAIILNVLIFVGCSSKSIYIAPEFQDKVYTNASLGVFYPALNDSLRTDSLANALYQSFQQTIIEYFPTGVKMFSSFSKVDIILYGQENKVPQTYEVQINSGTNELLNLPDSIQNLQTKNNLDFFLLFHNFGSSIEYKNNKNESEGFLTRFHLQYSLWDDKSGLLVSFGFIKTKQECKIIRSGWPYKSSMFKLASKIFENLPPFSVN